jgi:hypothetical protein
LILFFVSFVRLWVAGIHSRNTQLGNIRQTSPLVLQPLEKEKKKEERKDKEEEDVACHFV